MKPHVKVDEHKEIECNLHLPATEEDIGCTLTIPESVTISAE